MGYDYEVRGMRNAFTIVIRYSSAAVDKKNATLIRKRGKLLGSEERQTNIAQLR